MDQVIIAEDEQDMGFFGWNLIMEYKMWGVEINVEKTQYGVKGKHILIQMGRELI